MYPKLEKNEEKREISEKGGEFWKKWKKKKNQEGFISLWPLLTGTAGYTTVLVCYFKKKKKKTVYGIIKSTVLLWAPRTTSLYVTEYSIYHIITLLSF